MRWVLLLVVISGCGLVQRGPVSTWTEADQRAWEQKNAAASQQRAAFDSYCQQALAVPEAQAARDYCGRFYADEQARIAQEQRDREANAATEMQMNEAAQRQQNAALAGALGGFTGRYNSEVRVHCSPDGTGGYTCRGR